MARPSTKHVIVLALVSLLLAACGGREIALDTADFQNERMQEGAELFYEKCAGCHSLDVAAAEGSAVEVDDRERVDGPDFDVRPEDVESILYAIRNGGFSGAIMPENIVVGEEAQLVAEFLAKYAGRNAVQPAGPDANPAP